MRNYTLLVFGIAYIIEGIFGLFGYQLIVPSKYDGFAWTKKYIQGNGVSRILLGVPWLILFFTSVEEQFNIETLVSILIIASLPSLAFDIWHSIKFKKILKREIEKQPVMPEDKEVDEKCEK